MGKIAALLGEACRDRERSGVAPGLRSRVLADGGDWLVEDVVCTYRPSDAAFEEQHDRYRIALVGAGAFQCRGTLGSELLTPGSLLLGNVHDRFECGHEHATGDRCLAFAFSPGLLEQIACDAGLRKPRLGALRVPPVRELAPLVAEACAAWQAPGRADRGTWEELGVRLAAVAARLTADSATGPRMPLNAERGVACAVQLIEHDPGAPLALDVLARQAKLSRFHFVRAFARVTGLTPHQYLRRARLRAAAVRLATGDSRIIDVAMTCGFPDVSNFNRAFRAEFGATPREQRARFKRRH